MPTVRVPSPMRDATGGNEEVVAEGQTILAALESVCEQHPDLEDRLFRQSGALHGHLAVMVDGAQIEDLRAGIDEESEVVVIPAIGGGAAAEGSK